MAKSRLSTRSPRLKRFLNSWIAAVLLLSTKVSKFAMIALILAMQSLGPNFWMGAYLGDIQSAVEKINDIDAYHSGYARVAWMTALLAIPPYKTSP